MVLRPYAGIFETAAWLLGMVNSLCDLPGTRAEPEPLLDIVLEKKIEFQEWVLDAAGENALVAAEADDLEAQNRLLIFHDMYRKYAIPLHRRLFDYMKRRTGRRNYISFHCCAMLWDFIPDLIERCFDILNPWQVGARDMDTQQSKKQDGNELTVWGGGCDTQFVLPYGRPEQVRRKTKRHIDLLVPAGGSVSADFQNVPRDIPVESFMAIWGKKEGR